MNNPKVFISGGGLPADTVWSPSADLTYGAQNEIYIKLNRTNKFAELCGVSLNQHGVVQVCHQGP